MVTAEPLAKDSPLLGRDNVIISPHTGFYSIEALEELQTKCAADVARVLSGEKAVYPISAHDARTGFRRALRFLADADRAAVDRLQRPSQHRLLQRAVRPRGGRSSTNSSASAPIISNSTGTRPWSPKRMCAICASCSEGDPVRVTLQLLDYDAKRIHLFEQLLHAERKLGVGHVGKHDACMST